MGDRVSRYHEIPNAIKLAGLSFVLQEEEEVGLLSLAGRIPPVMVTVASRTLYSWIVLSSVVSKE